MLPAAGAVASEPGGAGSDAALEFLAVPGDPVNCRAPGGYLLDPSPAITRAGLVEDLARTLGAWKIDPMIAFLSRQEPWASMQREGFIRLHAVPFGQSFEPLDSVRITLLPVPHRSELGVDTVGLLIDGPHRKALYVPDIDSWDEWDVDLREIVGSVDLALLDGCFWEPFHIPGVPHPPIRDYNPALPEWIVPIIDKALHKDHEKRYQTGAEFAEAIRAARKAAVPA